MSIERARQLGQDSEAWRGLHRIIDARRSDERVPRKVEAIADAPRAVIVEALARIRTAVRVLETHDGDLYNHFEPPFIGDVEPDRVDDFLAALPRHRPTGVPVELASIVLGCFDLANALGIDLAAALPLLMRFEETSRP